MDTKEDFDKDNSINEVGLYAAHCYYTLLYLFRFTNVKMFMIQEDTCTHHVSVGVSVPIYYTINFGVWNYKTMYMHTIYKVTTKLVPSNFLQMTASVVKEKV